MNLDLPMRFVEASADVSEFPDNSTLSHCFRKIRAKSNIL